MAEYDRKELSTDPADYITGPTSGQINRTHGGTTRDGAVQVVKVDEDSGGDRKVASRTSSGQTSETGSRSSR